MMKYQNRYAHIVRAVVSSLVSFATTTTLLGVVNAQSLTWLGTPPREDPYDPNRLIMHSSVARGVSINGQVVVGGETTFEGYGSCSAPKSAIRWVNGARNALVGTCWTPVEANDVSADGQTVVGLVGNDDPDYPCVRAYRWTPSGLQRIGPCNPYPELGDVVSSGAYAVSADGRVVVGYISTNWRNAAVRWIGTNAQDIGHLGGGQSIAYDVSAGGSVVVGSARTSSGEWHAFRWIDGVGMQGLGVLPGRDYSAGLAVSPDGQVVVGVSRSGANGPNRAFYWSGGAMVDLGTLGTGWSIASDISADGSIIVGSAYVPDAGHAVRWVRSSSGTFAIEDLNQTYASLLPSGSVLFSANAISPDGRYIVGYGRNATTGQDEAYILDTGTSISLQYRILIGDRDQERGVLGFDPINNTLGVFGACQRQGSYRYYYGIDIHPQDQTVWVCDVLAQQIVVLDANGNCLRQISTSSYGNPHGIAIHPNGRYAYVTFYNNILACYDIDNNQWASITTVSNARGLYGIECSPGGMNLYVCDLAERQIIALAANSAPSEIARTSTTKPPYDVAVVFIPGGRAPLETIYVTEGNQISAIGYAYDTPSYLPPPSPILTHPVPTSFFFGIAYSPSDKSLWVNDYNRRELYQVPLSTNPPTAILRAVNAGKFGLGVALFPRPSICIPHFGDVNEDDCIDDADLLAVLFAFGSTGSNLGRVDVTCDGVVDDADLLIVLFNFGSGC